MAKVLVAYATMSGSTADVAEAVAEEVRAAGIEVDLEAVNGGVDLSSYDGVVLGGPMIVGWHRAALRFLRRHRKALRGKPVALFVTAMSLTATNEPAPADVPLYVDESLPEPPANPERLTFRERYARLSNYLSPMLRALQPDRPASVGVFGGRLEYGRLPWWAVVFAMGILRAPGGDRRNWPAIRTWAAELPAALGLNPD